MLRWMTKNICTASNYIVKEFCVGTHWNFAKTARFLWLWAFASLSRLHCSFEWQVKSCWYDVWARYRPCKCGFSREVASLMACISNSRWNLCLWLADLLGQTNFFLLATVLNFNPGVVAWALTSDKTHFLPLALLFLWSIMPYHCSRSTQERTRLASTSSMPANRIGTSWW